VESRDGKIEKDDEDRKTAAYRSSKSQLHGAPLIHSEEGITTGATADCAACTVVRCLNTIL